MPRTLLPPFTYVPPPPASGGAGPDATFRLIRALDRARVTGAAGTPALAPAVWEYVAACRARAMPRDATLAALDALVQVYACHRGPGAAAGSLCGDVARWGREAYPDPA